MMKKLIILLLLSSCSFRQLPPKEINLNKSLLGWWERYYPTDEPPEPIKMTLIEFTDDGECRINMTSYKGNDFLGDDAHNNKWVVDSVNPSNVIVSGPFLQEFVISVLEVSKSNLKLKLIYHNFTDTAYMKKLPKLH